MTSHELLPGMFADVSFGNVNLTLPTSRVGQYWAVTSCDDNHIRIQLFEATLDADPSDLPLAIRFTPVTDDPTTWPDNQAMRNAAADEDAEPHEASCATCRDAAQTLRDIEARQ